MFGYNNPMVVVFPFSDPTEDETFPAFRVPSWITKMELKEAWVSTNTALSAGPTNGVAISLIDGGTDASGTAIMCAALGGTGVGGTFPAWAVATPQNFTVTEGTLDANDYIMVKYDESGTAAGLTWTIQLTLLQGIAA